MDDAEFMRLAIATCRAGIAAGQRPFGAVLARGGRVIAATHNTVLRDADPTAHAEINCLRRAASDQKGPDLSGTTLYSTCEPCPMCLGAIHWARVARVVFGASIVDSSSAGLAELRVGAAELARLGGSPVRVESGLLADECRALFDEWLVHQPHSKI